MKKLLLLTMFLIIGIFSFGQKIGYNIWLITFNEKSVTQQTTELSAVQEMCDSFIPGVTINVEKALETSRGIDIMIEGKNLIVEKVYFVGKKKNGKIKTKQIKHGSTSNSNR